MDANKLKVLREIGYAIHPSCGLCVHGVFRTIKDDFGACQDRTYEHLKHTGEPRQLSVHRNGSCPDKFTPDPVRVGALGAYAEFVKGAAR